jgi:hypothetical protein
MGRLAAVKAKARKAVHAAFSYSATYKDGTLDAAVPVDVRWHNRLVMLGDYDGAGYANVIDGIERIIFDRDQLGTLGITPRRGGVVVITENGMDNTSLTLDTREKHVGPLEEKWVVTRDDE